LENRLVLASASVGSPAPLPAPPPVPSNVVILSPTALQTVRQIRADYTRQVQLATLDLRNVVAQQVRQLYANGAVPTSQQLANLTAGVEGAVDAAALQLSSQAALLPGSAMRLVPAIQNALLGSNSNSLSSMLNAALQSSRNTASVASLQAAIGRAITTVPTQINPQFNSFFNTTNVNQASVNSSGQQIPLGQFMEGQVVSQLANSLGTLAQNLPGVANSVLFPNGTSTSPTQQLFDQFGVQARNALSTVTMQVGSDLAMFPGSSSVIAQIQPMLFGSSSSSLLSGLQSLPFGTPNLGAAVTNVFNSSFDNFLGGIDAFFGAPSTGISTTNNLSSPAPLPTTGLRNPFGPQLSGTGFNSGFNNGFLTTANTNPGFVGFGVAPTTFNTNFGTGFNNAVTSTIQGMGLVNTPLGTIGFVGGVPVESR
jgi:hypothetical protein